MTRKQKTKGAADTEVNPAIEIEARNEYADVSMSAPAHDGETVMSGKKEKEVAVTQQDIAALMAEIQSLRAQLLPKQEEEEEWVSDVLDSVKTRDAILSFIRTNDGYMAIGEYEGEAPYIELVKSVNLMVKRSKSLSVFQPHEPTAEETMAVYAVIGWNDYAEWDSSFVYKAKSLGARVITLRSLKDIPAVMKSIGE